MRICGGEPAVCRREKPKKRDRVVAGHRGVQTRLMNEKRALQDQVHRLSEQLTDLGNRPARLVRIDPKVRADRFMARFIKTCCGGDADKVKAVLTILVNARPADVKQVRALSVVPKFEGIWCSRGSPCWRKARSWARVAWTRRSKSLLKARRGWKSRLRISIRPAPRRALSCAQQAAPGTRSPTTTTPTRTSRKSAARSATSKARASLRR